MDLPFYLLLIMIQVTLIGVARVIRAGIFYVFAAIAGMAFGFWSSVDNPALTTAQCFNNAFVNQCTTQSQPFLGAYPALIFVALTSFSLILLAKRLKS